MGRWEPGAQERLAEAAMELYLERGFEQTTVADVAERAGLTARTFFRYFADKREVLFAGSELLAEELHKAMRQASPTASPLGAVADALDTAATFIGRDQEFARRRQVVIAANPDLQERELTKLSSWSRLLEEELQGRGVEPLAAGLAAQTGVAVFHVAFQQWLSGPTRQSLQDMLSTAFAQLRVITEQ